MYVILVYDIEQKRVGKACKLCRKYLNWVQNSVFEGEISEAKLKEAQGKLKSLIDPDSDSVLIYKLRTATAASREIMGVEKNPTDAFI